MNKYGHLNIKHEDGKKYGKLTVLRMIEKRNYGQVQWLCQCECGNITIVKGNNLRSGTTKSCGCMVGGHNFKGNETIFRIAYNAYKGGARQRNLSFDIPYETFKKFIQQDCFYCKTKPNLKQKHMQYPKRFIMRNGIDRLDPQKGYFLENIVTCCKRCNEAKKDMTVEKFKKWVFEVYHCLFE